MPPGGPVILLTGAGGQLGRDLAVALAAHGDVVAHTHTTLDLADAARVRHVIRSTAPQFIVNAGAYTAVDRAESERDAALAVNGRAAGILAEEAKRLDAVLIHYSTDYVFDGARATPYGEDDPTGPLNVYGATKLAGERAIAAVGAAALTLRTSWVYSRHGQNFLTTMQRLGRERDELRVVSDQTGVPNWTHALAQATATLVARGAGYLRERAGLYHLSAGGATTWYEFARAILAAAPVKVTPITTAQYPTPARRPAYGVLDSARFRRTFGFGLDDWRATLEECLRASA